MSPSTRLLNPSEAASQLGVSAKALRLYEQRGLIAPARSPAGWRAYGPDEMARAAEIVELRAIGLSLGEVARVLSGDAEVFERALATHQTTLEHRIREIGDAVAKVRRLRADLTRGETPAAGEMVRLLSPARGASVAFDLPWPWGGERFELRDVRPLNYIVGPLGSGKTRLAMRIAETLPDAVFLGLDRLSDAAATRARLNADPTLEEKIDGSLAALVEDGGTESAALVALLAALQSERLPALVIDMVEQGLDGTTQEVLIDSLRRRGPGAKTLFVLTRSNAILDLDAVGADETIILCPANHSPPRPVAPYAGSPGYEAVATCLASPDVRARTEGVIAWRPAG